MDRSTVYTSQQGRSVDFLFAQRATMIGLAKLSQAAFGSSTVVRGLAVTPNSPAALNVLVGIGEIYTMAQVDATTWGALGADTADTILKQGLSMSAQAISTPAPSTPGYSINYLIEAQYQDQDTNPVVLPFYNSSNPQQPLNGQGGGGATLPTQRQGICVIQAKAGVAATTGTQTTPTVDSGWTALAVVTVANGQTTVTAGNIAVAAGVPQVSSLLQMMQTGSTGYAVDTSTTPNQITLALTPAITAYTDGQEITFKAANNNNGACTINAGPGSISLVGAAGALQGGEIIAGGQYSALYSASLNEAVLNSQTAGAQQVNPATKGEHAVQFGQVAVFGAVRNLRASVTTAGTSVTYAADAIVVKSALNGISTLLSSYNQTLNVATTGAGGMDTGSAPANGYVAVYASWGPTAGTGIFGQDATAAAAPEQYGGAHLPVGVTETQLIGVWPTDSSGKLMRAAQNDRTLSFPQVQQLSAPSSTAITALTLTAPYNAKSIGGAANVVSPSSSLIAGVVIASDANSTGFQDVTGYVLAGSNIWGNFFLQLITPRTVYWFSNSTGFTVAIVMSSYTF